MLSCRQVTEVCSTEMDRPLKFGERVSLRTHLLMCTGCRNYRKQMKALRQVMQAYAHGKAETGEPKSGAPD
jgi:hypothetical protein